MISSVEQLQAIVDETWNRHDAEAVSAAFAEDAVMRVVALAESARGRAAIRDLARSRLEAFPDWHVYVRAVVAAHDRACVELRLSGTHGGDFAGLVATGRRMTVDACAVFSMTPDGLVASETVYFDLATILRQLGSTDVLVSGAS